MIFTDEAFEDCAELIVCVYMQALPRDKDEFIDCLQQCLALDESEPGVYDQSNNVHFKNAVNFLSIMSKGEYVVVSDWILKAIRLNEDKKETIVMIKQMLKSCARKRNLI